MAGNQPKQYAGNLDFNVDPRLAEWSEGHLPPLPVFDQPWKHEQGPFPHIPPYSIHTCPEYPSPFQMHNSTQTYPESPSPFAMHNSNTTFHVSRDLILYLT